VLEPRSVVVLNSYCHVQGGASRVALDEAIGLAARGVSVTFFGAVGPVSDELKAAPLRVVCLGQGGIAAAPSDPRVALQGLWNRSAYTAMSRVLAELNPRETVVHLHGFSQALSSSPIRCALERGFKVIYTLHEYFAVCPNGGFFDYRKEQPCHRRPLSIQCLTTNCDKRNYAHKAYRVVRTSVQRWLGHMPDGVRNFIALSARSADVLRPYLPAEARMFFLGNPIEVPRGPPVDAARNRDVVAIGRLEPEKGLALLAEAAKLTRTQVTFVGEGSLRAALAGNEFCRVTGWLPRQGVLSELERARCLAFPSLVYETFGLSVTEAAAKGVPAIVSDRTGAAERVEDNVTGWHTRGGDLADLIRCMQNLRDDERVRRVGQAAYAAYWRAPLTRERHTEELLRVYASVLN
jgi:glycosyltransferase involved in cell wall biosynthesis